MNDQLHAPAVLPLKKESSYPIGQGAGCTQSQSGLISREKNTCLCWELNYGLLAHDVKILTELPQLKGIT
jgi:hypothetical protein